MGKYSPTRDEGMACADCAGCIAGEYRAACGSLYTTGVTDLSSLATVSGTTTAGTLANAVDGDHEPSAWASQPSGNVASCASEPLHLELDLGDVYAITDVTVWMYYADGRAYCGKQMLISTDHGSWTPVVSHSTGFSAAETSSGTTTVVNANARYVKLSSAGSNMNPGVHFLEVRVNGGARFETEVGPFAPSLNQSGYCELCPEGWYKEGTGTEPCVACEACSAGQYRTGCGGLNGDDGRTSAGVCTLCDAGTFKAAPGPAADGCTACPAGKYQGATGQADCDFCSMGATGNDAGCIDRAAPNAPNGVASCNAVSGDGWVWALMPSNPCDGPAEDAACTAAHVCSVSDPTDPCDAHERCTSDSSPTCYTHDKRFLMNLIGPPRASNPPRRAPCLVRTDRAGCRPQAWTCRRIRPHGGTATTTAS